MMTSHTPHVVPGLDPGGAAKRFRGQSPWNGCRGIHAVWLVTSNPLSRRSLFHAMGRRRSDAVDGRIKSTAVRFALLLVRK